MPLWLGAALAVLLLTVALHAASSRISAANALARLAAIGGAMGAGLVYFLMAAHVDRIELVAGLALYAFVCELYVFVFTLSLYSVSANLLARLRDGELTAKQIHSTYGSVRMVEIRIARLVEKNLLTRDGNRLRITASGRLLVDAFLRLGAAFGTLCDRQ